MEIKYNVTGDARKALVTAIGELTQIKPKYLGPPSFAYQVGDITVGKKGELIFGGLRNDSEIELLLERLCEAGFEAEVQTPEEFSLTINVPHERISDTGILNLRKLVAQKAALIKEALAADSLEIEVTDDWIRFPWFHRQIEPEESLAYTTFISKLVELAKTLKRVNSTAGDFTNEKYSFRCYLIKLGLVGDEYRSIRKVLLKNLSGSSAFKNGTPPSNGGVI